MFEKPINSAGCTWSSCYFNTFPCTSGCNVHPCTACANIGAIGGGAGAKDLSLVISTTSGKAGRCVYVTITRNFQICSIKVLSLRTRGASCGKCANNALPCCSTIGRTKYTCPVTKTAWPRRSEYDTRRIYNNILYKFKIIAALS